MGVVIRWAAGGETLAHLSSRGVLTRHWEAHRLPEVGSQDQACVWGRKPEILPQSWTSEHSPAAAGSSHLSYNRIPPMPHTRRSLDPLPLLLSAVPPPMLPLLMVWFKVGGGCARWLEPRPSTLGEKEAPHICRTSLAPLFGKQFGNMYAQPTNGYTLCPGNFTLANLS